MSINEFVLWKVCELVVMEEDLEYILYNGMWIWEKVNKGWFFF